MLFKHFRKRHTVRYVTKNMTIIVGIVLIWRGIWYALDGLDMWLLGDNHLWTALLGIGIGLLILYLPDKNLKELERL